MVRKREFYHGANFRMAPAAGHRVLTKKLLSTRSVDCCVLQLWLVRGAKNGWFAVLRDAPGLKLSQMVHTCGMTLMTTRESDPVTWGLVSANIS